MPKNVITKMAPMGAMEMEGSTSLAIVLGNPIKTKPIVNIPLPKEFKETLSNMKAPARDYIVNVDNDIRNDLLQGQREKYISRIKINIPPSVVSVIIKTKRKVREVSVPKIISVDYPDFKIVQRDTPIDLVDFFSLKLINELDPIIEDLLSFNFQ